MARIRYLPISVLCAFILSSPGWAQAPGNATQMQHLHDALHLRPDQQQAWQTFQAATATDPQEAARRRSAVQLMPTLTAPRRVDLSIAAMRADLQALERRGAALKSFYATLTPDQQRTFDQQTAPGQQQFGQQPQYGP